MASYGQTERQRTRRRDGKYSDMNKCERCRKSVGSNYYSDGRSDGTAGWVLCRDCQITGREMEWADAVAFYRAKGGR